MAEARVQMRAALYARVSSEEQVEGYSIDAQRRAFKGLCEGRNWLPYREYLEEGRSARTDEKRPEFKRLIADALSGQFDVLVVHKLDRFSRNLRITLEYFDRLSKAGVTFVSINEQIDFTAPWGQLSLALLGGLAQFYSDNLSQETKKGWHERRRQGLYCGALPFGAMKGDDGIPIADTQERRNGHEDSLMNCEGLRIAFDLAAEGRSDREIAIALNDFGYRTTGTHGSKPFSKDTVKDMLNNRFYLGFIPDGNDGWIEAKHKPLIEAEVFEKAQLMRARRTTRPQTVRSDANVYSLSGLARCGKCGSTMRTFKGRGRARLVCNSRLKTADCDQPSSYLDIYEGQLLAYLKAFRIPPDYQKRIMEDHAKLETSYDVKKQQASLENRMLRLKNLYKWGHLTEKEYLSEYAEIDRQLKALAPVKSESDALQKLASFLSNIGLAWEQAEERQRNSLATCLFEAVWITDKKVMAVTPREEFKPFFDLQYEGLSHGVLQWRPRGDSNP